MFTRTGQAPVRRCRPFCIETLEERIALAAYTVTNTASSGPGSLRLAIEQASVQRRPGRDRF